MRALAMAVATAALSVLLPSSAQAGSSGGDTTGRSDGGDAGSSSFAPPEPTGPGCQCDLARRRGPGATGVAGLLALAGLVSLRRRRQPAT